MATDQNVVEEYLIYRTVDGFLNNSYGMVIVKDSLSMEELYPSDDSSYMVKKTNNCKLENYLYNGKNRFFSIDGFVSDGSVKDTIFEYLAIGNDNFNFIAVLNEHISMRDAVGWKQLGTIPVDAFEYRYRDLHWVPPISLSEIISRNWKIRAIKNKVVIYVNDEADVMELKLRL